MDLVSLKHELSSCLGELGIDCASMKLEALHSGRSGAWTYAVSVRACRASESERRFVLRVQPPDRIASQWQQMASLQRLAAEHGLAPRVVHADPHRRWLLSERVADTSLLAALQQPNRASAILRQLGSRIGALHAIPVPAGLEDRTPLQLVRDKLSAAGARFRLPEFARRAREKLDGSPHDACSQPVLCHFDLNPTNLLFDGQSPIFCDWETAGAGDGWFDVATPILWLQLDEQLSSSFVQAYVTRRGIALPSAGVLDRARQLVRVAYGAAFLDLVQNPQGDIPLSSLPSLVECYRRIGAGSLDLASDAGRWQLAAALLGAYLSG